MEYYRENNKCERDGAKMVWHIFSGIPRDRTKKEKHSGKGIAIACVTVIFIFILVVLQKN